MSKKAKNPPPFTDKGLYELDPEPTPEERARMTGPEQFKAWLGELKTLDYLPAKHADWQLFYVKNAHPLLAALEAAKTPAKQKAAQAAIDRDGVASEVQRRLKRFEEFNEKGSDFNSFKAGFELACAYLLATSGTTARRGKPMLKGTEAAKRARAERGTRSKKENLLKSAIQDAWECYLDDLKTYNTDKTKTHFAYNWLCGKCEEFEITFDEWEGKEGLYRHRVSGDEAGPGTVRRWPK